MLKQRAGTRGNRAAHPKPPSDSDGSSSNSNNIAKLTFLLFVVLVILGTFHSSGDGNADAVRPRKQGIRSPFSSSGRLFTTDEQPNDDLENVAWLMTFPNSGTSYTLANVRAITGLETGTNYGDASFQLVTPDGPFYTRDQTTQAIDRSAQQHLLIKTHCFGYCSLCSPANKHIRQDDFENGCRRSERRDAGGSNHFHFYPQSIVKRTVHLIRHPIDNMVSRFNYAARTREKKAKQNVKNQYPDEARLDDPTLTKREKLLKWCSFIDGLYLHDLAALVEKSQSREVADAMREMPFCAIEIFKYVNWHDKALIMLHNQQKPVHRFFYEDYSTRYNQTVVELLDFLHIPSKGWEYAAPFAANKTYIDILTPPEQQQVYTYIEQLASPELWNMLNRRYLLLSDDAISQ